MKNKDERGALSYNVKGCQVYHYKSDHCEQFDCYINDKFVGCAKSIIGGIALLDSLRYEMTWDASTGLWYKKSY